MITQVKRFLLDRNNLILLLIIIVAAFLRLYRISDYMTFLGDEGRDVLTVKHILEGQFTLLGPRSSAADFYYGPIYYYLITPFLWLFHYDPVGPAIFIAVLGVLTVFLIYIVGKKFFNQFAGLVGASLYAVSPIVVAYSHSSWNPNPLPFVALLSLYILYTALLKPRVWKFLVVGGLLGIAMQLQYLALFLLGVVMIYLLLGTILQERKILFLELCRRYFYLGIGFLVGWSPFLLFEIYHGFPNLKTLFNLLLGKYSQTVVPGFSPLGQVHEVFFKLFGRLVTTFPLTDLNKIHDTQALYFWYLGTLLLGILSTLSILIIKDKLAKLLFICWLIVGISLFGFYKKEIYDYYLGFMFTLPFLLVGNLATLPFNKSKNFLLKGLAILLFATILVLNLSAFPFKYGPNRQKQQTKNIAEFVISKTANKPFNFALITPGNSDHGYRYFMEILGHKPVEMENFINDPKRSTVTDQLLIVCEDTGCKPLGYSLFEVAGFGRAEIVGEWDMSIVKIFRMVHYTENKTQK